MKNEQAIENHISSFLVTSLVSEHLEVGLDLNHLTIKTRLTVSTESTVHSTEQT